MSVKARRATYAVTTRRPRGAPRIGPIVPRAPRTTLQLTVTASALRCDFLDARGGKPVASLVQVGASQPWLLDHRARSYEPLVLREAESPSAAVVPGPEGPFGPTLRLETRGGLELWLLAAPRLPALETFWKAMFGALVPRRHRGLLPFAYELREGDATARVELEKLAEVRVDPETFCPPDDYALRQDESGRRKVRVPKPPPEPAPAAGPRESALGALLLAAGADERVKLQLRDDVIDRARRGINDVTQRLSAYSGEGLSLDLFPTLFDDLDAPGPTTPGGGPTITGRLLVRGVWFHLGTRLKRVFASAPLRDAFGMVLDAALAVPRMSVAGIEPGPAVSDDERALFHVLRDFVGGREDADPVAAAPMGLQLVMALDSLRRPSSPADTRTPADRIDELTFASLAGDPVGDAVVLLARRWFALELGSLSFQPEIELFQDPDSGYSSGWRENGYLAEGLGDLIDLQLDVDSVAVEVARLAVVFPASLVDETDARFAPIDAVEQRAPGSVKRTGIAARVRLNEVHLSGAVTTTPTTHSAVVVALAIFQPHLLLALFNYVGLGVSLRGATADVIVYLEQERLSPAGPKLKVWVSRFGLEGLDVSGGIASASPAFVLIGDLVLNVVADGLTPALLDRLRAAFAVALDRGLEFAIDAGSVLLTGLPRLGPVPLPPEPPDLGPSTGQMIDEALVRKLAKPLLEEVRMQTFLNLDRETEIGALAAAVTAARDAVDPARAARDARWDEHVTAATAADVDLPAEGFNPGSLPAPILSRAGAAVSQEQLDALQRTFDAWAAAVAVLAEREAARVGAEDALDAFVDGWPAGQTAAEGVPERGVGYRVALGLCRPDQSPWRQSLVYPAPSRDASGDSSGDLTLLISGRQFQELTGGTGFSYIGDIRRTDGSPAVLPQLPVLDWWTDAADTEALGPRPENLRDGPPPLPPDGNAPDWRAYWSRIDVGGQGARLVAVSDPAPGEHVAEIAVVVTVLVLVTTFTAVMMERCGPDLTKLAGGLDRPPLSDPGRFRPPVGPGGPDPRPDGPDGIGPSRLVADIGLHRAPSGLEPGLVTASDLEDTRLLVGFDDVLFSHPGGPAGMPFAGDAHCKVVPAWDIASREELLRARLELRFPVWVGLAASRPDEARRQPGGRVLGVRGQLPALTYRYGTEPVGAADFTVEASGPLAALASGVNRTWVQQLLTDHARALVGNDPDPHRAREEAPLRYAYGIHVPTLTLSPEGFSPYAILGMHANHWSGETPPPPEDTPPTLALETFGPSSDTLHLAIRFRLAENVLNKLTG